MGQGTWPPLLVCALAATALLTGCRSLPDVLQDPPRWSALDRAAPTIDRIWPPRTFATGDGVALRYRRVEPDTAPMRIDYQRSAQGFRAKFEFDDAAPVAASVSAPVTGSVVFLHGWGMSGETMLPWAGAMAARGLRGIVVDLRNHGGSGHGVPGFGRLEGRDVAELIAALQRNGEITPPVYLFGVSYGAATAVFTAQRSDGGIAAVVALEPFDNAADAVRGFARADQLIGGDGIVPALQRRWIRHRFSPRRIDAQIDAAQRRFGYRLADVDVGQAMADGGTCTLVIHGGQDALLAPAASQRMAEAAAPWAHYVQAPYDNHLSLPVRVQWLADPIVDWLASTRAGCPAPSIPADPLPPPG